MDKDRILDVALAVIAAFAQGLTAYWGWRLISTPLDPLDRKRKLRFELGFIFCGMIGIAAMGLAAYRAPHQLSASDVTDAVRKGLPANFQGNVPTMQQTGAQGITKADITRITQAAIAAANPNALPNLTIERLIDLTKQTEDALLKEQVGWGSKQGMLIVSLNDPMKQKDGTVRKLTKEERDAAIKLQMSVIDADMRAETKDLVLRAYNLRQEILNHRLETWETKDIPVIGKKTSDEVFENLKAGSYDVHDLGKALQYLGILEKKLQSHLPATAPAS